MAEIADLVLQVNGVDYGGWTTASVRAGLQDISGQFQLTVTELWPMQAQAREIRTGDRCVLTLAGETVISGYVDSVAVDYSAGSHSVRVAGRDATGDLVDCSAIYKSGEWRDATLDQIANDLCGPFGVKVSVETELGAPFKVFAIQEGESVFEALERAARHRGVLLITDRQGGLVLGKPSQTHSGAVLELGVNILSARGENRQDQRFSEYLVKGQRAGDDNDYGEVVALPKASATDPGVKRYRPKVFIAEDQADQGTLEQRAKFEASINAARALIADVVVQGWTHEGTLWVPNRLVTLRDPWLRVDRDLLVADVEYSLNEQGTTATLSLTIPEAFSMLPVPEPSREALL